MRTQEIHHIGHAVEDLDAAIGTYQEMLGGTLEHRETVPEQGVEAAGLGRRQLDADHDGGLQPRGLPPVRGWDTVGGFM